MDGYNTIPLTIKDIQMKTRCDITHIEYKDDILYDDISIEEEYYPRVDSEFPNDINDLHTLISRVCMTNTLSIMDLRSKGKTYSVISKRLNMPISTVYYRYHSGIRRLRRILHVE